MIETTFRDPYTGPSDRECRENMNNLFSFMGWNPPSIVGFNIEGNDERIPITRENVHTWFYEFTEYEYDEYHLIQWVKYIHGELLPTEDRREDITKVFDFVVRNIERWRVNQLDGQYYTDHCEWEY